jgi:hypothetical protein
MKNPKRSRYGDYELRIKFPVFSNYTMFVVFSNDLCASRMARYGSAGAGGESDTGAFVSLCSEGCHIFLKPYASAGIVTHEAWHAVRALLVWAEARDFDNEVVAYHLGYLVNQITDFQNRVKARKSRSKKVKHGNKNA